MSRGVTTFRQRDLAAAIRGARSAGLEVARVEVGKDGKISIIAGKPNETADSASDKSDPGNEWDVT